MPTKAKKKKKNISPWGVEIELFNDRCVYLSAEKLEANADNIIITIKKGNAIAVPRSGIRRMLVMSSYEK